MTKSKDSTNMETKTYPCNYRAAARWLNGNLILCNEVENLYAGLSYPYWQEMEDEDVEIYQYYLTNYSDDDCEFLREHFGLMFAYSNELDLNVLLVPHYGTSWDYVYWETDIENASCGLGEDPRAF